MSRLTRRAMLGAPAAAAIAGQALFTVDSTFVVPAGVTSICAVAIGPGGQYFYDDGAGNMGSGGGGGLAYANNIAVTPGESLFVVVRSTVIDPYAQGIAYLKRGATSLVSVSAGSIPNAGAVFVGTGFQGGQGAYSTDGSGTMEGAGAGGYTSVGQASNGTRTRRGGGGTSPLGGSTGANAGASANLNGANYGGGAAYGGTPGLGCVRIIWGAGRAFPNTNTGDV